MAAEVDPAAAREALRAAEKVTSRQLRLYEILWKRAGGVVRLGVAELGGIAAIAGFALGVGSLPPLASPLILVSVVLGLIGVGVALHVTAGQSEPRTMRRGPDLDLVREGVAGKIWSEDELDLALVGTHAADSRHNLAAIDHVARRLAAASYWLIAAAGTFMMAVLFIVGSEIHA